ncbi:MAG: hypothetical protein EPN93_12110 [Spirochaetes bacterium]|nr:MAG: hypothetical protein EPN93_12110 [Spirochaetota bacterium]
MTRRLLFIILAAALALSWGCKKDIGGVMLENAALRDKPTTETGAFKWIANVNRGQELKVLMVQKDGDWMEVVLPDGTTKGWIQKQFVFEGKKQVIEFDEKTKLHEQPDGDSPVKGQLAKGTKAIVIAEKGDWVKAHVNMQLVGWVKKTAAREAPDAKAKPGNEIAIPGIGKCQYEASSALPDSGGYNFGAANLFDGNPGTTWQVGNDGIGQWIAVSFPEATSVTVSMINGFVLKDKNFASYGADGDLYVLNNRVKSMRVEITADNGNTFTSAVNFEDNRRDLQNAGTYKGVKRLKFIIDGVYKGTKWQDTALAELKLAKAM